MSHGGPGDAAEHGPDSHHPCRQSAKTVRSGRHAACSRGWPTTRPSDEAFLFALADALHEEYRAIVEAVFLLQLDNPNLPDGFGLYTDLDVPAYRRFQELRIAALNRSIVGLPASRIRMHVCWGAHKGPHNTDIPLKDIVDLMLDVKVEAYSVEAANPRHAHEWHLWEHVKLPAGKILIPGVVGHDSDTIEDPELVAERLCNYASVVGRDNVIVGTDCGFGTSRLHSTIAHLKLQTLVEGARLASQKLWDRSEVAASGSDIEQGGSTMQHSTDRILTTHAGSLARPADLLAMVRAKEAGQPYDHAAFAARVRTAVAEVVRQQIDAGIDVVSDGEQGKPGFANYVKDRLTGLVAREGIPPRISSDQAEFPDFQPPEGGTLNTRRMVCIGPLEWQDRTAVQTDIENFTAALQDVQPAEAFLPTVSPGTLAQNVINEYYKDEEAFLRAVAEVMREEYHAIVQAGFLLQIDSPDLAMSWHTQFPDKTLEEFRTVIARRVEALNHALAGISPERVRHHICWGNGERPHHKDVELQQHIIDILLTARTGALYVEGANPRHGHEWKVFREVRLPAGMVVIPGVIDTKTNIIEHPELVVDRIMNYASVVGRENVIAGTDCGFGTSADRTRVAPSISWAKLQALAEGARLASARLWG